MRIWRVLVVLPLLLLVAACGFRPLYGSGDSTSPGVAQDLASVAIAEPKTRLDQVIRNDLLSTMRPAGTAAPDRYRLDIEAKSSQEKLIEDSSDSRRSRRLTVRVTASFALKDLNGGKTVYQGRTFSNVSYDDVNQSFADLQARTSAVERGAREIALDIRTRLAAHFASARND
ncbi:MAG: LPS assembly lipoprotein LptE [Parvibaculaceae bacterium]